MRLARMDAHRAGLLAVIPAIALPPLGVASARATTFSGATSSQPLALDAAGELLAVVNRVQHRSAGTGGVHTLTNAADRQKIVSFLSSIDAATPPIP